jgi:hypothetical protein
VLHPSPPLDLLPPHPKIIWCSLGQGLRIIQEE